MVLESSYTVEWSAALAMYMHFPCVLSWDIRITLVKKHCYVPLLMKFRSRVATNVL